MKNHQAQIDRKSKPATASAQPVSRAVGRVRFKLPLTANERRIYEAAAKRRGITLDELLERAIEREIDDEKTTAAPQKRRFRFLVQPTLKRIIKAGAKRTGVSVSKFVESAIREVLAETESLKPRRTTAHTRGPIMHDLTHCRKSDSPQNLQRFWQENIALAPWFDPMKEHLVTVIFDTRYRICAYNLVSIGIVNECLAHPREILRPVIAKAGFAFAVMHNHPSGLSWPSVRDRDLTKRISAGARLLDLTFLDHVIIADGDYFSFEEEGTSVGLPLQQATARKPRPRIVQKSANRKGVLVSESSPRAEFVIPKNWEEVAHIDFFGFEDRDCEERTIYKTPQGELKAQKQTTGEPDVIEDVTRGQVRRWILECVIPEEFEADFRCAIGVML